MPTFIFPASFKQIFRYALVLFLTNKNRTSQRWTFLQWLLCLWLLGLQPTLGWNGASYSVYPCDEGGFGSRSWPTLSRIEQPASKTTTLITNGAKGNQRQYRANSTSGPRTVFSQSATFTQEAPPSITVQPLSRTVCSANGIQFSVQADGTDLRYAWQYYDSVGGIWVTLDQFKTNTLTISDNFTPNNEQFQVQYRAVVSNGYGSVTSQPATLTKLPAALITQQPVDQIACSSKGLQYTVQVKQEEDLSYYWEFNDGRGWASLLADTNVYKGYNTGALTIKIDEPTSRQYRVKINNRYCTIYSDSVAFTKLRAIVITQQPISHTICSGDGKGLTYSVLADGDDLGYDWEFKDPGMIQWESFSNFVDTYPDYTTATLTANGVETPGRQYRVKIINDCGTVYSESATFTLTTTPPAITQQPISHTVCSGNEDGLTYSVKAAGDDLTYEWEFKDPATMDWASLGGQYAPLYPGYDTPTLTTNGTEANGRQYRVKIMNSCGSTVYSEAATLTITPAPTITQQPQSRTACSGSTTGLTYTVVVESTGPVTYEWEFKDPATTDWASLGGQYAPLYPGYDTPTLTTNGTEANGRQYRVKINNGCAYSNPAILILAPTPTITQQPQSRIACSGKGLTYSVQADGQNLTYEWEFNDTGSRDWASLGGQYAPLYPGYDTPTLTTNGTEANGRQYRVKVMAGTCTVYSQPATFTQSQCTPTLTNFSASPTSVTPGQPIEFTATVGGVTAPYNYTLSNGAGSDQTGTASGSNFSQRLTAQGNGPQTYTLTIGNSPYTVTGTTVVTVASFAITDLKAFANPVQSGQSVEFTATFEGLIDTDLYKYTLTNGQEPVPLTGNFYGSSFRESITARGAGVQVFTLTVVTRDKGTATAAISVTVVGDDIGLERFAVLGVTAVDCETLSETKRQLRFTPRYAGANGEPISFSVVNELSPTTQPGPYTLRLYIDNPTITLVAQQGNAQARYSYDWLAHCSTSPGSFTLTGARIVDCQLENPNFSQQYRVSLQPSYANQDNAQPISFSVVDELSPTTQSGPYTLHLWGDKPVITLVAQQGNVQTRYAYNWLASCGSFNRARRASAQEDVERLQVKLLGNPITNHQIRVEVKGVTGQHLELTLMDLSGRTLLNQRIEKPGSMKEYQLQTNPAWSGPLLLRVRIESLTGGFQQQTVKVIQEY
ncbi:hypothetical protein GK091_25550 [Spirosoma agri]|uniref:PKD domain-containing protein n=1 Tax=Spirosoma agri TaxID=1987381 RepID=A0A6M0IPR8_9BACT|nr:hypothetical protein [Spirosoma agri]NEU70268.1 hypothetical protein [Spirosoma agri]